MNRMLTAIFAVVPVLTLVACGGHVSGGGGYTKAEASALDGVDDQGNDICAAEGWYGDDVCDSFCPTGDGADCGVSNQCPSGDDPAVHYIATADDYVTCMVSLWTCADN